MAKRQRIDKSQSQDLFLREEFIGDRLINYIRFFLLFILLALALLKANLFGGLEISKSLIFTLILILSGYVYTITFYLLYRKNIYRPLFKYFSVTLDITLVVLSIYSYKLDPYPVYAQIFLLARFSLLFWFILWSLVRYNIWLALYSGLIAGIEYFLLIVLNNKMNDLDFTFTAPDGISYTSSFLSSESLLRVVYLILGGVMAAVVTQRLRRLIANSIAQEQAKNKLAGENQLIEAVNRENRKYLDGITQGLLLIDQDYIIGDQYSRFLSFLFPRDDIAGLNFVDFLFPENEAEELDRKELSKYLQILFTNMNADLDMLREVNPLSERTFRTIKPDGTISAHVLSVTFHRLYENDAVTNIMAIFEDRTDVAEAQRDLEEERHRHEGEVETISVILKTGPKGLQEFIEDSRTVLMEALDSVGRLGDQGILNNSFRKIHGLKGSAATLGFSTVAEKAHALEDILVQIRDGGLTVTPGITQDIEAQIKGIFTAFDTIQRLTKSFLKFAETAPPSETPDSITGLEEFFESLRSMTEELAEQLDKKAVLNVHNTLQEAPFLSVLRTPLIHLVRNSVDHGLEDVYERLSKGKEDTGTIVLNAHKEDQSYVIELSDDGRGLDYEQIRKKGIERSLLPSDGAGEVSEAKLLKMLFSPGFSTNDTTTTVSGRGVGLDIVRDALLELGGRISVTTGKDKGTKFTLTIPV